MLAHDAGVDSDALRAAWRRRWPDVQLHQVTSCGGVMGSFGLQRGPGAIAAFGLRDREGVFGCAAAPLAVDSDGTLDGSSVAAALERASQRAGRPGEAPDLLFVSTVPGFEEQVLGAIEAEVGSGVPIAGGSAADDDVSGKWSVGDADASYSSGVVISALYPSTPPSFVFSSGYVPAGPRGVITRAEGRRIYSIDDEPAAEVYDRWTGGSIRAALDAGRGEVLTATTLFPLGWRVDEGGQRYVLAHPAEVLADGSLTVMTRFETGQAVELMTGSTANLVARPGHVVEMAKRESEVATAVRGALMIYCAGCMLSVGDAMCEVPPLVDESLGAPFLGLFTFGEQGCPAADVNFHGNLMISLVVFHG
ncbi:MAG: FIST C-terminal domain-containing protein [Myxococcales bacterium]|nr:FIST C-terminal domain-containing protein [Myxococcales bacterium]